jgi:hypothetical protein
MIEKFGEAGAIADELARLARTGLPMKSDREWMLR